MLLNSSSYKHAFGTYRDQIALKPPSCLEWAMETEPVTMGKKQNSIFFLQIEIAFSVRHFSKWNSNRRWPKPLQVQKCQMLQSWHTELPVSACLGSLSAFSVLVPQPAVPRCLWEGSASLLLHISPFLLSDHMACALGCHGSWVNQEVALGLDAGGDGYSPPHCQGQRADFSKSWTRMPTHDHSVSHPTQFACVFVCISWLDSSAVS